MSETKKYIFQFAYILIFYFSIRAVLRKLGLWTTTEEQNAQNNANATSELKAIRAIYGSYEFSLLFQDMFNAGMTQEQVGKWLESENNKGLFFRGIAEQILDAKGMIWDNEKKAVDALKLIDSLEQLVFFCDYFRVYVKNNKFKLWFFADNPNAFDWDNLQLGQYLDYFLEPENYVQIEKWAKNLPSKFGIKI